MDDLTKALRRLKKPDPSRSFLRHSKRRIMEQVRLEQKESWFTGFLKKTGKVLPPAAFRQNAYRRLMAAIQSEGLQGAALSAWQKFYIYFRRGVASTLVMLIAVTTTLFFVEGRNVVEARDESVIRVLSGQISVRAADQLLWKNISDQIHVSAGDLIRTGDDSQAEIEFFDDTRVRLNGNSTLLIDQMSVSPVFSRQAQLRLVLHEGEVWAQTLSVDDGVAGLTVATRDTLTKALNASFNVRSNGSDTTSVMTLRNNIRVNVLQPGTKETFRSLRLLDNEMLTITTSSKLLTPPGLVEEAVQESHLASQWIQNNLVADHEHQKKLRKMEYDRLTRMAGTLPGEMLYPIKQAKERLKLAFSFDSDQVARTQIEIANQRLSEAVVLMERGEYEEGQKALEAYKELTKVIAEEGKTSPETASEVTKKIVTPHQKVLVTSLPTNQTTGIMKDTLNETRELLAEDDPIELERLQLKSSIDNLKNASLLVEEGRFKQARQILQAYNQNLSETFELIDTVKDEKQRLALTQELVDLKHDELKLYEQIDSNLAAWNHPEEELDRVLSEAITAARDNMDATIAYAAPLIPELKEEEETVNETPAVDPKVRTIVDRIYIYKTWNGQRNQIERLLEAELENSDSIDFLNKVRNQLEGRPRDYISGKILQLESQLKEEKHKAMLRKIDRAKKLREENNQTLPAEHAENEDSISEENIPAQ